MATSPQQQLTRPETSKWAFIPRTKWLRVLYSNGCGFIQMVEGALFHENSGGVSNLEKSQNTNSRPRIMTMMKMMMMLLLLLKMMMITLIAGNKHPTPIGSL
jgi:hypothetical protein